MQECQQLIWVLNAVEMTTQKYNNNQSMYANQTDHSQLVINLGVSKITNFQPWCRTSIQQCVFQLQISVAYLLHNGKQSYAMLPDKKLHMQS